MRRVLPSDVVRVIEEQFAWTKGDWRRQVTQRDGTRFYAINAMPGVLRMIERIPEDLFVFDSATEAHFTISLAALEDAVSHGACQP